MQIGRRGIVVPRLPVICPEDPVRRSDRLFQILGSTEGDLFARLDLNGFAGRRVAAHARGAPAHLQDAKPADANALALLQMLDDVLDEIGSAPSRLASSTSRVFPRATQQDVSA